MISKTTKVLAMTSILAMILLVFTLAIIAMTDNPAAEGPPLESPRAQLTEKERLQSILNDGGLPAVDQAINRYTSAAITICDHIDRYGKGNTKEIWQEAVMDSDLDLTHAQTNLLVEASAIVYCPENE